MAYANSAKLQMQMQEWDEINAQQKHFYIYFNCRG